MSFKKLALVTAMFAATSGAYAMEAMDEEALAAATGQDGITVSITVPAAGITMNQIIHDTDGWDPTNAIAQDNAVGAAYSARAGAIVIGNAVVGGTRTPMKIVRDTDLATAGVQAGPLDVTLVIDADGGTGVADANSGYNGGAFLNIGVGLQSGTTITTGDISVAKTTGLGTVTNAAQSGIIMKSSDIVLGATNMNIQLGNESQTYVWDTNNNGNTTDATDLRTAMIKLDSTMVGGLTINNFSLSDTSTGGGDIAIGRMRLRDDGGADLTIGSVGVNVVAAGLRVDIASIGGASGLYQSMERVQLGANTTAALGDIEVIGLNLNGTSITITGH